MPEVVAYVCDESPSCTLPCSPPRLLEAGDRDRRTEQARVEFCPVLCRLGGEALVLAGPPFLLLYNGVTSQLPFTVKSGGAEVSQLCYQEVRHRQGSRGLGDRVSLRHIWESEHWAPRKDATTEEPAEAEGVNGGHCRKGQLSPCWSAAKDPGPVSTSPSTTMLTHICACLQPSLLTSSCSDGDRTLSCRWL